MKKGQYALSLAGRGKGRIYAVTEVNDGEYLLIADGGQRAQSKPKRKKIRHLRFLDGCADLPCTDRELRAQIAAFEARVKAGGDLS